MAENMVWDPLRRKNVPLTPEERVRQWFITVLKDQEGVITEFDDALWSSLVEKIVVKSKEDVTVVFKDGTEMKAE